ncbi:MAG: Hsp20/alpha crystallin family protein [Solirubrobacteraceae bacterium]
MGWSSSIDEDFDRGMRDFDQRMDDFRQRMDGFHKRMEKLHEDVSSKIGRVTRTDSDELFCYRFELPDFRSDEVSATARNGVLRVSARQKTQSKSLRWVGLKFISQEKVFVYDDALPEDADPQSMRLDFANETLTVTFARSHGR